MRTRAALTSVLETFPRERLRLRLNDVPFSGLILCPTLFRNSRAMDRGCGQRAVDSQGDPVHHDLVRLLRSAQGQLGERVLTTSRRIESDPEAAALVAEVNDGDLTVPTL